MKRKLLGLLMCLVLVFSVFAGCNLFERDTRAYLDQVVAKSNKVEITMEELIDGYYQYGQYLVSNYGLDAETSVRYTIDWLINREYVLGYVEGLASEELADDSIEEKDYKYALTNAEYNELVRQVWGYVDDNIESIIEDIEGDSTIFDEEEDTREAADTKVVYQPTTEYVDGKVQKVANADVEHEEKLDKYAYVQNEYKASVDKLAWDKYISNLKKSEKGKKLSTKDTEVFNREIDRMFKILYENKMISKFQETYESYYGFDSDGVLTETMAKEILDQYKLVYNRNYETYNDISSDTFYSDMISTTDRKNVYYYYDTDEFYEVSHILIMFSDDQKNDVKEVESDPYLTPEEKAARINDIKSKANTVAVKRDENGYDTEMTYTITELETYINGIVADLRAQYTDNEVYAQKVAEAFDELKYQFNDDPGVVNNDFDYVVGKNHSGMIESFTEESRRLGVLGEGSVSTSAILGDSGYHIIICNRVVKNVVEDADDMTLELLSKTYTSRTSGKSYLEYIKNDIVESNYSSYESMLISTLKDGAKTVYYTNRYKSLYN